MMNLTNLEKATEILKEIKSLDQQVIANEKLAMQLLNGDELVTISINRPDGNIIAHNPILDEDTVTTGMLWEQAIYGRVIQRFTSPGQSKTNEYTKQVTPPAAVRICQFIHDDLVTRRSKYVSQLEKLGFKF